MKARPALPFALASLLLAGCQGGGVGLPDSGVSALPVSPAPAPAPAPASDVTAPPVVARAEGSADPGMLAQTAAERRADLDGKLDASLDSFDEKLRREQQRNASERDADANSRAHGAVVDATSNGERDRNDLQRDRSGDLQSTGAQRPGDENGATGPSGAAPREIPSGVDDDIIARRLRRAAEAETDPELKEKLWDEYRDYKENTKGGK